MHFVERHGLVEGLRLRAVGEPGFVVPVVAIEIGDFRGGARRELGGETVRIGFVDLFAVGLLDAELVERAFAEAGDEQFPDAAGDVFAERMAAGIPVVEIADDADALRVGGPDGEVHAFDTADVAEVGAELGVALPVRAFAQQVQIVLC